MIRLLEAVSAEKQTPRGGAAFGIITIV